MGDKRQAIAKRMGDTDRAAVKFIIRVLNAARVNRDLMIVELETIIERGRVNPIIFGVMEIEENLGIGGGF